MEGVQNLRKAVYEYVSLRVPLGSFAEPNSFKLKAEAAEIGSAKHKTLFQQGVNYLYRCELPIVCFITPQWLAEGLEGVADAASLDGTMIILANFLLETKEQGIPLLQADFPGWMQQHREISSVLSKSTLD